MAQWEYAARAGSRGPFICGSGGAGLEGYGNRCDDTPNRYSGPGTVGWDDGQFGTAPVGTDLSNGFGLHDVHGKRRDYIEQLESPSFGPMTANEWNNTLYKHTDHHLQQFGA